MSRVIPPFNVKVSDVFHLIISMLEIIPYRQKISHCGPACLKMVLSYYGYEVTEARLAKLSGCTIAKGTPAKGLLKAAKQCGFEGLVEDRCTPKDIAAFLKRKIPPIVDWFSTDDGHYSVVVKIDDANIWLQDPELGYIRAMRIKTFQRLWFDFSSPYMRTQDDLILRRIIAVYPGKNRS